MYSSFKGGNNRKTEKKNRPRDLNKQQIVCAFHFHSRPSKTCFVRYWSYQPLECCLWKTLAVSQSRGYWLPSQYFKDAMSSSGAAGPFQCPAYLEFHRGHVLGLGDISRLHMGRLRVLKIPTMLCARTNFPKSVVENVRRGLSYDAHLHTC